MIKELNSIVSQLKNKCLKAKPIPEECNLNSSQLLMIRLENLERLVEENEQKFAEINAKEVEYDKMKVVVARLSLNQIAVLSKMGKGA